MPYKQRRRKHERERPARRRKSTTSATSESKNDHLPSSISWSDSLSTQALPPGQALQEEVDKGIQDPFHQLHRSLHTLPSKAVIKVLMEKRKLCCVKYRNVVAHSHLLSHSLTINSDLSYNLFVHSHQKQCITLKHIPLSIKDKDALFQLLGTTDKHKVCVGQPDVKFVRMVNEKRSQGGVITWNTCMFC